MRIVFIGAPGAGKTTQAKVLARRFGVPHVSTGQVFRRAIESGTELGLLAAARINKGQLVPDEVAVGIIVALLGQPDFQVGWILDGFPRTLSQAVSLDAVLRDSQGDAIDKVICLQVSQGELQRRLVARQRGPDDQPDAIAKRLDVFQAEAQPVIDSYLRQGRLLEIDGEGPMEDVTQSILANLT